MRAIDRESFDFFLGMFFGEYNVTTTASTAKEHRELSNYFTEHAGLYTLPENFDRLASNARKPPRSPSTSTSCLRRRRGPYSLSTNGPTLILKTHRTMPARVMIAR